MTVLEFLRTADENAIAKFLHHMLDCCECGVSECPLNMLSDLNIDICCYSCDDECMLKFLKSGVKTK